MLLGAESFDLYGGNTTTSLTDLILRGYVNPGSTSFARIQVETVGGQARTGAGYLRISDNSVATGIGKILDAPVDTLGAGVAFNCIVLAATSHNSHGLRFGTGAAWSTYAVLLDANLGFGVYSGGALIASSAPNLYVIGSYYYLEAKMTINSGGAGTGTIEVRLNGTPIMTINGVNIPAQFTRIAIGQNGSVGNSVGTTRFDDWVYWDGTTAINNDFLGDRRCVTCLPDADTASAQWTPSTGVVGFAMIDEAIPNDADYISALLNADISEFQKADVALTTNDVCGVIGIVRALKTDAGLSNFRIGIHSGAFVDNSAKLAPNTTVGYFQKIWERDPNGTIQWTNASIDAATLRLTRDD